MNTFLQVAIGGAIGATGRYAVGVAAMRGFGPGFPAGTLIVNIAGSFLMGLLVVGLAQRGGNQFAPLLLTGMLGGFTTFSAFSLDAISLWERGQVGTASVYVIASVLLSLLAVGVGLALGRGIWA
ncbi:CrcB protein [Paracoccus isoporae]|uniref:Fluoride-specific ion channel FluC n=1 Tax=Paracoccus isoporae TaxID=591205 RepID=A0A1G6W4L5_9RHOB|nr:fluoride efflux transporter CrcB [Paracoccus isoporae]SDD60870.1 CrcB protein [Paracoccus isoporae]